MRFIKDSSSGSIISYEQLIDEINTRGYYIPAFKSDSFIDWAVNFIFCLINNIDVVLIDSDISQNEIDYLNIDIKVNEKYLSDNIKKIDISTLSESIFCSSSRLILFTSGTTGAPKRVDHQIASIIKGVRIASKHDMDIWALAYNPTHMAGLQVFLQAILNGNTLIYVFKGTPQRISEEISINNITHISATPTFYRINFSSKEIFHNIKRVTVGGEKANNEIHIQLSLRFPNAKISNIYASTEIGTLLISSDNNFRIPVKYKDLIKIVDNELIVHRSLLANNLTADEWYHTGDMVSFDTDDASFRFIGRQSEIINIGGYKVNPSEVEEIMLKHSGIKNAVVYGKPNSVLGNILCADIEAVSSTDDFLIELNNYLRDFLQEFKIPRIINFKEVITTRTGKINRKR